MLQFTANLSLLFSELDLIDRFEAAKACGFDAVEIQFPYTLPAEVIKQKLHQYQLKLVLFNVDADDLLQGGEGLAAVPEKQKQFVKALGLCHSYAEILEPAAINVLPGRCKDHCRYNEYVSTFKKNLSLALDNFTPLGVKTVFEAVNTFDMPDFLIHNSEQMLSIIEQIDQPMLYLQYDIYHMQKMNENVIEFIETNADKIGHIQFADVPGRGQPGTGMINFPDVFSAIEQSSYTGWVGAEYKPVGQTNQSLHWLNG